MRVTGFVLALGGVVSGGLTACGGAAKSGGGSTTAKQTAADPGSWKQQMTVYTDGGSRVVAVVLPDPERESDPDPNATFFYGDKTQLEAQNVVRYDAAGMKFEVGFDDPARAYSPAGALKRTEGVVTLSCGEDVKLTALPANEAQALLGSAKLVSNRNAWRPHSLSVSPAGDYYYSDTAFFRTDSEKREYRIRKGKKGDWKEIAVTGSEHDKNWNWVELMTAEGTLRIEYTGGGEMKTQWGSKQGSALFLKGTPRDDLWEKAAGLGLVSGDTGTPCAGLAK